MNIENPTDVLASIPAAQNLKFERPEWTSFRTVDGLQQKAGVATGKLRRLVLKELADNALDSGDQRFGHPAWRRLRHRG